MAAGAQPLRTGAGTAAPAAAKVKPQIRARRTFPSRGAVDNRQRVTGCCKPRAGREGPTPLLLRPPAPAAAEPLQTGQRPAAAPAAGSAATWGEPRHPSPSRARSQPFGSACDVRTEQTPLLPTGSGLVEGPVLPALHGTARYGTAQHGTALCCVALHCIALHCIALHCIALPPCRAVRSGPGSVRCAMP